VTILTTERPDAFDSRLSVQEASDDTWRVLAPLIWTGTEGDTFTVPVGFVTDFATVPRFLIWKVRPYGPYTRAAVLHDWLLVELAKWTRRLNRGEILAMGDDMPEQHPPATSREIDGIFRRAMEDLGVSWVTRWQMWAAVRLASCFNSRRAYGRQFWRDAPAVFGVLLVSSPLIVPAGIVVLLSLILAWPFTGRRPWGRNKQEAAS
jgi:hypothetical protein